MFAIVGQQSSEGHVSAGGNDTHQTETIWIPPSFALAQVSLSSIDRSRGFAAITGFTHRLDNDQDKPEQVWTSVVGAVKDMSSVTWWLGAGPGMTLTGRIDIYFWGEVEQKHPVPGAGAIAASLGKSIVLYDPASGEIAHAHTEVVLRGARAPGDAGLERRARAVARSLEESRRVRGLPVREFGKVDALQVPAAQIRGRLGKVRVDVEGRRLVELQ